MTQKSVNNDRLLEIFRAKHRRDSGFLIDALADPDRREMAAELLGELGDPAAIPPLLRLLDARGAQARAAAAIALGQLHAKESVSRLMELAKHDHETYVRGWAIDSLGRIGDETAVPVLIQLLDDPEMDVRLWAAAALGRMRADAALPHLARARKREPWHRRSGFRHAERVIKRNARAPQGDRHEDRPPIRGLPRLLVTLGLGFALALGLVLAGANGWVQIAGTALGALVIWRYTGTLRLTALIDALGRLSEEQHQRKLRREHEKPDSRHGD